MSLRKKQSYLLLVILLLAACATTEFKPFEAKVNVFGGVGGTKTIIEGMEVWDNGEPPRKFKILGIIDDERPGGPIPMASLESDIVQKAREVAGDALIQLNNNSQLVGVYSYGGTATTYGSSMAIPMKGHYSSFVVIKFLD